MEFYPDKSSISNDKGFINVLIGIFLSCSQHLSLDHLPGQTVERYHPEAGHHRPLPLGGDHLLPHVLVRAGRMFHLHIAKKC